MSMEMDRRKQEVKSPSTSGGESGERAGKLSDLKTPNGNFREQAMHERAGSPNKPREVGEAKKGNSDSGQQERNLSDLKAPKDDFRERAQIDNARRQDVDQQRRANDLFKKS